MSSSLPVFTYPLLIRETFLDVFGHVNNAAYLTIFEEARWDILAAAGYGMEHILAARLGPTVLEVKIRYRRELRNRMQVVVKSQVDSAQGRIWVLRQWIEEQGTGVVACEAYFTMGLFDLDKRKLVEVPEVWMPVLGLALGEGG